MVAPSLVMVTSPISSTSILSRPTGPREDLIILATEAHARTERLRKGGYRFAHGHRLQWCVFQREIGQIDWKASSGEKSESVQGFQSFS
jgi:hypothetical protein